MAKTMLIYERAVPVNARDHRKISIKAGKDYSFAKVVNSVPLMAVEFDLACSEYPIVFTGEGRDAMPAVLLGVRDNENLHVDENGEWASKYIPAFIRRYPFVFSSADGVTFTLCLDEKYPGVNKNDQGERLFDSEGTRTQYLQGVLNFLQSYQAQFEETRKFCQRLVDLDLLEPMRAQFALRDGQKLSLGGFKIVSRDRLKKLPGDDLSRLATSGDLDLIYAHLHSQRNYLATAERVPLTPTPLNDAERPSSDPALSLEPAEA
jgi:hypothetical protein